MNSGGSNIGGMTSAISELQNGINNNNQHELLQMVQQNTGIQIQVKPSCIHNIL